MKRPSTFTVIIALTMIISACGAQATPTVNPADIQNTAMAAALTMLAETQAAIPTATPVPPTEAPTQTALPTITPLSLPTLQVSPTTAPASNSGNGDPCANRQLGVDMQGKPTKIRILNTTKSPVTVSIYLNETELGACGYRSYKLAKGGDVVMTDVVYGCYSIWAWSDDPKGKFNSSGGGCINNPDKWTFEVNTATVKFVGP